MTKYFYLIFTLTLAQISSITYATERPNILIIIADDLGVDALNGYDIGSKLPGTPNIDALRESGLTFTNVWASPLCAPTRAAMLTGKYGVNSGINTIPGILKTDQKSIFKEINELTDHAYESCVVGKWHNSRVDNIDHPLLHGADDFMGFIGGGVEDYFSWPKVEDHVRDTCSDYASSYFTNYAVEWISKQTKPWFMWLAHIAPHTPLHVPPDDMYTSENVASNLQQYLALIESLDYEIGRLLDSIPQHVLDNTVILFVGDNGTPSNLLQGYTGEKGKGTVYQGGIHVPMIVSGKGVDRKNEKEDAMINVSDFYITIAQLAQNDAYPENRVNDSYSFKHLFSSSIEPKRNYNYMDLGANDRFPVDLYTIRNTQYKILYDLAGNKEMFDLISDPLEEYNLLGGELSTEQVNARLELEQEMFAINGIDFKNIIADDSINIPTNSYPIVETDVTDFYNNNSIISAPLPGESFYGQDASYQGNQASYTDNGDGTITDNITGLMWEKDMGGKISYDSAFLKAADLKLGGYDDWRVPTIKELYSLARFSGRCFGESVIDKFIDTAYFNQPIGNTAIGEREIDAQTWSATKYSGLIMRGETGIFGFNFVDGRLKAYPRENPRTAQPNTMYFRMVRGNTAYGINKLYDNGDGTITDSSTMLMWQQADDGITRDWEDALAYCEDLSFAGHSDWRLPNAKELHSIIDYSRSPDATDSPAIDNLFSCTVITNPLGDPNYGYYWTSSPLMDGPSPYTDAVYHSFGEAQGQMSFPPDFIADIYDVHGAGASRSDPKEVGAGSYPDYHGPQGDIRYVNNFVRAVRSLDTATHTSYIVREDDFEVQLYPNPVKQSVHITFPEFKNGPISLELYDTCNHLLFKEILTEQTSNFDMHKFKAGVYIMVLQGAEMKPVSKLLVKSD